MKTVKVDWLDSGTSKQVWVDKDDYPDEGGECTTVGFLIKKTNKAIIVCQSVGDEQYGNIFVIPKGMVKKVKELGDTSYDVGGWKKTTKNVISIDGDKEMKKGDVIIFKVKRNKE